MHRKQYILFLLIVCALTACTPYISPEAEMVVAEADSLWRIGQQYGIDYGDSATLAEAYKVLEGRTHFPYTLFSPRLGIGVGGEVVSYHYGRLLRAKDNPVEAMQVFIRATHSRTKDYHILGRIYSNMGDMCHIASEFQLSYDMFEKSADMFLKNGDSLNYYYALNDMAFELAEQGKKDETFPLINRIEESCTNTYALALTSITKAEMFRKCQQYDSAIYYTNKSAAFGVYNPMHSIIKAQSFSKLGTRDSAIIYAGYVLEDTLSPYQHRFNALYILSHNDTALNSDAVRDIASQREDIRYYEYEPKKEKLTYAVQLLEQDSHRSKDIRGWVICLLIIVFCTIGTAFLYRWNHQKMQMRQQMYDLEGKQSDRIIESIRRHIDSSDLEHTLHWKHYSSMKLETDLYLNGIVSKLEQKKLNETEIRFCILTLLGFPQRRMAMTLNYSYPSGIKTLKKRISDKLGTSPSELKDYLLRKL